MNYTKSGSIAVGAPHSRMRYLGEAEQAAETPVVLLLTDEGRDIADRYFRAQGCSPDEMPEEVKAEVLQRADFFQFITGVIFALKLL